MKYRFVIYIALAVAVAGLFLVRKLHRAPTVLLPVLNKYKVTPGDTFYFRAEDNLFALLDRRNAVSIISTPSENLQAMGFADKVTLSRRDGRMFVNNGFAVTESTIQVLAFSPDEKTLAGGAVDGGVTLWDVADKTVRWRVKAPAAVLSLAFSPDGKKLAVGLTTHTYVIPDTVQVWDVMGSMSQSFGVAAANALAFSSDGNTLAVGFGDGTLQVGSAKIQTGSAVTTLALHPNKNVIATGHADKNIRLWDLSTASLRQTIEPPSPASPIFPRGVGQVRFDLPGRQLGVIYADGDARVWDVSALK